MRSRPMTALGAYLSLQTAKTALATSLAYEAGRATGTGYPVFAALAALLVVQGTVFESVTKGLQRTAGVVVGVLLSSAITQVVGLHWWSVLMVVLLGGAVGKVKQLGDTGSVQVPVSALLVLTVGQARNYPLDRVVETVIGAAIGIAVHALLVPPVRTRDAGEALLALGRGEAGVLREAGAGLGRADWADHAPAWLQESRSLGTTMGAAGVAVAKARTSLRLNPRGGRLVPRVERAQRAAVTLARVHTQTLGIMRTVADAGARGTLRAPAHGQARVAIGAALVAVADVVEAYGEEAARPLGIAVDLGLLADLDADAVHHAATAARAAVSLAVAVAGDQQQHDPTHAWVVHGAVLTDLDRLLDELVRT